MENVSTAAEGDKNLDPQSGELARLLAELVRAGWILTVQIVPNEWHAITQGEVFFERAWNADPPRTLKEDMDALKRGLSPQAPVHWKFDPFDPNSIYHAVKRFHRLFVENSREL